MTNRNILCVIPARGGSKGIPHKNIKELGGKPLICYSIDTAKELFCDEDICVTTDDLEIVKIVEDYGLNVPFIRPEKLATDTATTNDVLLHVIDFYEKQGKIYDVIVLLQPTSPFRTANHLREALSFYRDDIDIVVSVKKSHAAPVICMENHSGFLELCLNGQGRRRQEVISYYEYNGAIYIININSLKSIPLSDFKRRVKYLMDDISSIDIDNSYDWIIAEAIIDKA